MTDKQDKKIFQKMIEAISEINAISKTQRNQAQGYSFRGIDQFLNEVHRVFSKVGLFCIPRVLDSKCEIREVVGKDNKTRYDKHVIMQVEYTFYADDGSSVSSVVYSEGLDSGDKATNKAMSGALKYCLMQSLAIPTIELEDPGDLEDSENTSPTIEMKKDLTQKIENIKKLCITVTDGVLPEQKKEKLKEITGIDSFNIVYELSEMQLNMLEKRLNDHIKKRINDHLKKG